MLEGRLGDFTLPDILRLLAFTAKSGRLWVSTDGVEARIDVLEGRVRDAAADAARLGLARRLLGQDLVGADTIAEVLDPLGELPTDLELARRLAEADAIDTALLGDIAREQVVDALFELLRWTDGGFRFESRTPENRGPSVLDLALTVDDVLEEVTRRLEAHTAIEERTGHADAVVTISRPGRERAEVGLSPEGWSLLALIDGRRTVGDLVRLTGQGDYRTRRTLASLLDEGIVAVGDPDSLPPGERLLAAHETLAAHEARLSPADDGASATSIPPPATSEAAATSEPKPAPAVTPSKKAEAPAPAPTDAAPTASAEAATAPEAADEASATTPVAAETAAEDASAPTPKGSSSAVGEMASHRAKSAPKADAEAAEATDDEEDDGADATEPEGRTPAGVTSLRARARTPRVRTDPEVDEDLVQRLIDGVENL